MAQSIKIIHSTAYITELIADENGTLIGTMCV